MATDEEIVASALAEHGYDGPDGSYEKSLARDVAMTALRIAQAQRIGQVAASISRENEPPIGTWVKDRHGGTSYRQASGGWGEPGMMPLGEWTAMWDARGPYVVCGPWGSDLDNEGAS